MSSFKDLQKYIYRARRKGLTREEVYKNLQDAGWKDHWIYFAEHWLRFRMKKNNPGHRGIFSLSGHPLFRAKVAGTILLVICLLVLFAFMFAGTFLLRGPGLFRPDFAIRQQLDNLSALETLRAKVHFVYSDKQTNGDVHFGWNGDGYYEIVKNRLETATVNSNIQGTRDYTARFVFRSSESDGTMVMVSPDEALSKEFTAVSGEDSLEGKWLKLSNDPLGFLTAPQAQQFISNLTVKRYLGTSVVDGRRNLLYEATIPKNVRFGFNIPNREDIGVQEYQDLLVFNSVVIGVSPFSHTINSVTLKASVPSVQAIVNKLSHKGLAPVSIEDDQKRLSDTQNIANELERYYNKFGGYPKGVKGKPQLVRDFAWPTAPAAQNTCSEYYNTYWYTGEGLSDKRTEDGQELFPSYRLTFCLGGSVGNKQAGVNTLTPSGVYLLSCENDPYCTVPEKQFRDIIKSESFWRSIPLDSDFTLEFYLNKD